MDIRRVVIIAVSAAALALGVVHVSGGCAGQTTQDTIVRQGPPAAACLPVYLPMIVDAASKHDATAALVHTAELVACWAQHEPAPAPVPAPAPASGSQAAALGAASLLMVSTPPPSLPSDADDCFQRCVCAGGEVQCVEIQL